MIGETRAGDERRGPPRRAGEPDPARIADMIDDLSHIGGVGHGAVTRLGYTAEERAAHRQVAGWLKSTGLEVRGDAVGNTIGVRSGRNPSLPAIALGSHLDSVPHGGRFDGIVGVVAMVELMRLLDETQTSTTHPLLGVAFACEEGARFGQPCVGSKLAAGHLHRSDLGLIRDAAGTTLEQAMSGVGLDPARVPEARWNAEQVALFIELHVEQGNVMEAEGESIGLVDIVSGSTRLQLTVTGEANHSGATPMTRRADALMGAAEVALALERLANDASHRGLRATVGRMDVWPNSTTTIPGRVLLTVDIRDVDGDRQRRAAVDAVEHARWTCERRGLRLDWKVMADTSPTVLTMWVREKIQDVCAELGVSHRVLTSGASHDAQIIASVAPSAIVFVPSRAGLSHVPQEWTSAADVATGVEVLKRSVLRFDSFLAEEVSA